MPSDEAREVLLVLTDAGGGHRAAANALIAAALEQASPLRFRVLRLQDAHSCRHAFVVCGDNPSVQAAVQRLADRSGGGSLHVFGFTDRLADLLAASDVLLTKPGPGSLAEAFHHGVPVVVTCNARTVPQERWNAQLIREQGLGLVVDDWRAMAGAAAILRGNREWRWRLRRAIQALPRNRAVYEALDIIEAEAGLADQQRQERIVKV